MRRIWTPFLTVFFQGFVLVNRRRLEKETKRPQLNRAAGSPQARSKGR